MLLMFLSNIAKRSAEIGVGATAKRRIIQHTNHTGCSLSAPIETNHSDHRVNLKTNRSNETAEEDTRMIQEVVGNAPHTHSADFSLSVHIGSRVYAKWVNGWMDGIEKSHLWSQLLPPSHNANEGVRAVEHSGCGVVWTVVKCSDPSITGPSDDTLKTSLNVDATESV
ncbi:unnamed protein product [Mesocestoides corti]|uniref:PUD1_2 domain-containing protein n=1 Tax=Mesocestoides corti TaxID=53468 RepID=A0A0R3UML4_MESCO|nr:unnamed protein product [Mesocestoides corti]